MNRQSWTLVAMESYVISVLTLLVVFGHRDSVSATPAGNSSAADLPTLRRLAGFLSLTHATAQCPRKLTLGGSCECNYREPETGRNEDIQYDMHLYGQRRVCIGEGYLSPDGSCRVLSIQTGRFNGDPGALPRHLSDFGCDGANIKRLFAEDASAAGSLSLLQEVKMMGSRHLDLLDVSSPGRDWEVLRDLLKPNTKLTARQLALTVVLDSNEVVGDQMEYPFTAGVASQYLKLLTKLEAVGYRMLSFKPHPKCVEVVYKMHNICLPILSNTVWIK